MKLIETVAGGGKTNKAIDVMIGYMMENKGVILFNSEEEPAGLTERVVQKFIAAGGDLNRARGYVVRVGLYDTDVMEEADRRIAAFMDEFIRPPSAVIFDTNHGGKVREYFKEYADKLIANGMEVYVTVQIPRSGREVELPEYVKAEIDMAAAAVEPWTAPPAAPAVVRRDPAAQLMEFLDDEGDGAI
ncbi:hypothetical protein AHP1_331 [Aeromonas phage Ahp1_CNU-2021]|nr:hypothetical protein AHP1_331 [Aeromonas phage Ahp1_CNU-2021]